MALSEEQDELTREQLTEQLAAVGGNVAALAQELGWPRSTLRNRLEKAGVITPTASGPRRRSLPSISLDDIHEGMQPPNTCKVRAFLELLDSDSRAAIERALEYDKRELPAPTLREILIKKGFSNDDVPGVDAINNHRTGNRPCRCKG